MVESAEDRCSDPCSDRSGRKTGSDGWPKWKRLAGAEERGGDTGDKTERAERDGERHAPARLEGSDETVGLSNGHRRILSSGLSSIKCEVELRLFQRMRLVRGRLFGSDVEGRTRLMRTDDFDQHLVADRERFLDPRIDLP